MIGFFALSKWCLCIQQIIQRQDLTWFLHAGSGYIHCHWAFLAVRWCSSKNPIHIWGLSSLDEKLFSVCSFSLHLWISIQVQQTKFEDAGEMSDLRVTVFTMKNEPWLHLRATCLLFVDASHCPETHCLCLSWCFSIKRQCRELLTWSHPEVDVSNWQEHLPSIHRQ